MRKEYDRTRSTHRAVVTALEHTGRLVGCRPTVLAISFLSLITSPTSSVQMIASAVAFGIIVDAVIARRSSLPRSSRSRASATGGCPTAWPAHSRSRPPPPPTNRPRREAALAALFKKARAQRSRGVSSPKPRGGRREARRRRQWCRGVDGLASLWRYPDTVAAVAAAGR